VTEISDERQPNPSGEWLNQHRDLVFRVAILAVVLAFVIAGLVAWLLGQFELKSVGFAGVWLFSFISSASIVVPVPGLAAVCLAATPEIGLNPIAVGVVAGSAEALGEMTGYMAGVTGRSFVERHKWYPRIQEWMRRYGIVFLFAMSVVPNPAFDVVGIAAGSIAYPVRRFIAILFVAKSIKSIGVAYACYYGYFYGVPVLGNLLNG
jgi:membrane protein YqaA with SNARE-associated domain